MAQEMIESARWKKSISFSLTRADRKFKGNENELIITNDPLIAYPTHLLISTDWRVDMGNEIRSFRVTTPHVGEPYGHQQAKQHLPNCIHLTFVLDVRELLLDSCTQLNTQSRASRSSSGIIMCILFVYRKCRHHIVIRPHVHFCFEWPTNVVQNADSLFRGRFSRSPPTHPAPKWDSPIFLFVVFHLPCWYKRKTPSLFSVRVELEVIIPELHHVICV